MYNIYYLLSSEIYIYIYNYFPLFAWSKILQVSKSTPNTCIVSWEALWFSNTHSFSFSFCLFLSPQKEQTTVGESKRAYPSFLQRVSSWNSATPMWLLLDYDSRSEQLIRNKCSLSVSLKRKLFQPLLEIKCVSECFVKSICSCKAWTSEHQYPVTVWEIKKKLFFLKHPSLEGDLDPFSLILLRPPGWPFSSGYRDCLGVSRIWADDSEQIQPPEAKIK